MCVLVFESYVVVFNYLNLFREEIDQNCQLVKYLPHQFLALDKITVVL